MSLSKRVSTAMTILTFFWLVSKFSYREQASTKGEIGRDVDRGLYRCDKCGLQASLINGRGNDCPRCAGHFLPIHPLAVNEAGFREVCDHEGCEKPSKVIYWENGSILRSRCANHERDQHILWDEETVRQEQAKFVADVERRLQAEVEMDKYDKM